MKKFMLFSLLIAIIGILINCSDSTTTSSGSDNNLPYEFPLKEGNAWVYETVVYGETWQDTILDTLYIAGKYEDYYLYSWEPSFYFSLVKNIDNKLVNCGMIADIDTIFYDLPYIWAFYGETGYIDSSHYLNYYYADIDSEYISILPKEIYLGGSYDTYKREITYVEGFYFKEMNQYTNRLGFACWEIFDENNNLDQTIEMIEKLENVYPKEVLTNKKSFDKTIYTQSGMPLRKN